MARSQAMAAPRVARRRVAAALALAAGSLLLTLLPSAAFAPSPRRPRSAARSGRAAAAAAAPPQVKLYQFESCPFCSKVRAYCDYNGVNLDKVEVNPVTKAEIDGVAGDYKKVPIANIGGEIVTGSADIIRKIATVLDKKDSESDATWGEWVDSTLVKTLPPNLYRSPGEALQVAGMVGEKGNFDFVASAVAKYVGGAAMFFVAKGMAKKAGIEAGAEREALYDAVAKWVDALGDKKFLGGESPSMSDLEVFGVLASVEGTDTHSDMMASTKIGDWYGRMRGACNRA